MGHGDKLVSRRSIYYRDAFISAFWRILIENIYYYFFNYWKLWKNRFMYFEINLENEERRTYRKTITCINLKLKETWLQSNNEDIFLEMENNY